MKPINRRYFLKKVGLAGAMSFAKLEGSMLEPAKLFGGGFTNVNYPKPFRASGTTDAVIAMPTTRRGFTRMVDKIENYKSTVLAFTDLIIETYGRRR